jgi:hypothetical protein
MYGQAKTFFLQEEGEECKVPSSVTIGSGMCNSRAKKYKLFEVPRTGRGLEERCFCLIGQGTTFCTLRNCKTTHKGEIFRPLLGQLFMSKMPLTAFAYPRSSVSFLTPDLLVEWNSNTCTLEEWSHLFLLVNSTSLEGPTSLANLKVKVDFASKVEAHRTPGKRKADTVSSPMVVRASPTRMRKGLSAWSERKL